MEFLLKYLENKYAVNPTVKNCAEKVLKQLRKGSICEKIEDENEKKELLNSDAVGTVTNADGGEIKNRPLIFDGENLYVQRYFVYQTRIVEKIESLRKNGNFHIITGGPGTGKTTGLAQILKENGMSDKKILLAAPTGKAALRMEESLRKNGVTCRAQTLHRLLGYRRLSVNFKHTKENPLQADIIAIDECSMIDLPMTAKLLDAVPVSCRLYLLGDKNQLSSVEAGTVFADICAKFKDDESVYTELTKNYRAANAPGISALSREILESDEEKNVENFENENVKYFEAHELKSKLSAWYEPFFNAQNEKEALDFLTTFQILCAAKFGKYGTRRINKILCETAATRAAKRTPIMITQNDYRQNLYNGDVGVKDGERAFFYGDENGETVVKTFLLLSLVSFEDAFAITVHKSQGSEYEKVAVVYPEKEREKSENGSENANENEELFLTKELLYTAITRAKKECYIFGGRDVLVNSCKRKIFRASGI